MRKRFESGYGGLVLGKPWRKSRSITRYSTVNDFQLNFQGTLIELSKKSTKVRVSKSWKNISHVRSRFLPGISNFLSGSIQVQLRLKQDNLSNVVYFFIIVLSDSQKEVFGCEHHTKETTRLNN